MSSLPRRGPWLALASALALGGLLVVVLPRVSSCRARAGAEKALAGLRACVCGTEACDDDGLRRRAIAASLGGRDWPSRCARHASAAELALSAARGRAACDGEPRCEALDHMRGLLAELRQSLDSGAFSKDAAASLFDRAAEGGLLLPATSGQIEPAPAALPIAPDSFAPLFVGGGARRAIDPPLSGELRLLFHEPGRRARACLIAEGRARCAIPHASIPLRGALAWPAAETKAPLVLLWRGDESALYRVASGETLAQGDILDGHVARDGRLRVLTRADDGGIRLDGEPLGAQAETARFVAATPMWIETGEDLHIGGVAGSIDLAPPIALEPCVTPSSQALVLTGTPQGFETPLAIAFLSNAPTIVQGRAGARGFGVTCHDETVDVTWIETASEERIEAARPSPDAVRGDYRIARLRCRARGCAPEQVSVALERHHAASRYLVASLGDALALLWRSPFGDVRLRVAPFAEIADAPERTLLDDAAHGGFDWEGDTELIVRGDRAFLLVESDHRDGRAVHAIAIDARGAIEPQRQ
jgi:hypothetical protein